MKLYWQQRRAGQRLILRVDDESEVEVGAVRQTPRGFDALAKTNTYDPGRAQKGFATIEEAKTFVESFHPWEIFGGDWDLEVEPEVLPNPAEASSSLTEESVQATTPEGPATRRGDDPVRTPAEGNHPQKRGWQFWRKG